MIISYHIKKVQPMTGHICDNDYPISPVTGYISLGSGKHTLEFTQGPASYIIHDCITLTDLHTVMCGNEMQ